MKYKQVYVVKKQDRKTFEVTMYEEKEYETMQLAMDRVVDLKKNEKDKEHRIYPDVKRTLVDD